LGPAVQRPFLASRSRLLLPPPLLLLLLPLPALVGRGRSALSSTLPVTQSDKALSSLLPTGLAGRAGPRPSALGPFVLYWAVGLR